MQIVWWCLGIAGTAVFLVLLTAFICFMRVFYSPARKPLGPDEFVFPDGEEYQPYREAMRAWIKAARSLPHEVVEIKAEDGLTLRARYYEYAPGAPIEIMFHGYRGDGERDLSGGIERCFALGRSILLVDQRASGISDGRVVTFGIRERKDCLRWVDYAVSRFGPTVKLILTGVSMGGATVLMAAGEPLPPNVICVLADCSFTSPKAIISKVIRDMGLPMLLYPFIRLGARLFGGFDPEETSPLEAVRACAVPVLFFHGSADSFVPSAMSEELFAACPVSQKRLTLVPGAAHGLAYPVDKENYLRVMRETALEWAL
ncbi:MAG: alpha/beta hydrolase [Clostridia bacterium]|nr:alpha/beta hydrolase [Clostridia bacterium]